MLNITKFKINSLEFKQLIPLNSETDVIIKQNTYPFTLLDNCVADQINIFKVYISNF